MVKGRNKLNIKGKASEWGRKIARLTFLWMGGVAIFSLLIAFTPLPFWLYKWMGTSNAGQMENPQYLIMLGSGGVPGEGSLMRMWYVKEAAKEFPEARIIISIPGDTVDKESTISKTLYELEKWGVKSERLYVENRGVNTRQEALEVRNKMHSVYSRKKIMLITSPEHMRRAVLCFQKVGFREVAGLPAFEKELESNLSIDQKKLGGNKLSFLKFGNSIKVRYNFWMQLDYELKVGREIMALNYYFIKGWM
ncbi:MAG: YdcF family protein [Bacteroidota bacterium]|nr:YdcF family protein [Bacteroidota bacterium]